MMHVHIHWSDLHTPYVGLHTYTQFDTNTKKCTPPYSATTCSHGGPLLFKFGGHFDVRLISSCQILILHRALGSLSMKTYVWIPKSSFCDNWLESYQPAYIANVFWRPSWIIHFPPIGFFWTFTMSFCVIFLIYSVFK